MPFELEEITDHELYNLRRFCIFQWAYCSPMMPEEMRKREHERLRPHDEKLTAEFERRGLDPTAHDPKIDGKNWCWSVDGIIKEKD